jgi:Mrp family chromosome partitioning ATPase
MEKIQSAIAKARAAREGRLSEQAGSDLGDAMGDAIQDAGPAGTAARPEPQVAVPPATNGLGTDRADSAAAWATLPALKVDPGLMRRNRIVAFESGSESAIFDVMRTRLLQQMRANSWRRLAITSPTPGSGKTTTALNLAFSLARQSDQRTLLAEVDLRRPALARMLGMKVHHGFAQVLEGKARLADNAVCYGSNLAVATNHAPYHNPAELLHGPTVGPALAAIEAAYDPSVVIFDMPPMLVGDDALAFIGHVDCVFLVAAAEATTTDEVDTCERDLAAHTNVLGVILNKCRYPERRYGYSYG